MMIDESAPLDRGARVMKEHDKGDRRSREPTREIKLRDVSEHEFH
jgi:hypothetical protein